jgi:hypothetical protein
MVGTAENPDTLGLRLVEAARVAGIPSAGVVDAVANAAYRFRGHSDSPLACAPDWLMVSDHPARRAYEAMGYPCDRVVVCGHPHFDYLRQQEKVFAEEGRYALRRRLLPHVSEEQRVIVFVSELSSGMDAKQYVMSTDYLLEGRGHSRGRTEVVIEEFLDAARELDPSCFLVLRLHPKEPEDRLMNYCGEFSSVSSSGSSLELIYAADLVVGMTSMLLQEAVLMKRPVLSILPREIEKEWLPCISLGLIPCVTRREKIRPAIETILSDGLDLGDLEVSKIFPAGSLAKVTEFVSRRIALRS